jgi:hypothetical protein
MAVNKNTGMENAEKIARKRDTEGEWRFEEICNWEIGVLEGD